MTGKLSDFQEICNEWGKQFSKKHGTTCRWVKLHAEGWGMEKYQKYKISAKYLNTEYDSSTPKEKPYSTSPTFVENDTDVEQRLELEIDKSTTSSFTWSLTEGIKLGATVKGEIGLPLVAKGSVEASGEINFSSQQQWTTTDVKKWTVKQAVNVPPFSQMEGLLIIEEQEYDIDFTSQIEISGWVAIWNNDKINLGNGYHWLYFVDVTQVIKAMKPEGYKVVGNKVIFDARGRFTGVQGVGTHTMLKQRPLKGKQPDSVESANEILAIPAGSETEDIMNPLSGYISEEKGTTPED